MRVHQTGKKAVAEAISGMKCDEALRSVGIQLQILTFKEHGSRKQNRIPEGEPAGALEEKGGAGQVSSESHGNGSTGSAKIKKSRSSGNSETSIRSKNLAVH